MMVETSERNLNMVALYDKGMTYKAIGDMHGMSKDRARQIVLEIRRKRAEDHRRWEAQRSQADPKKTPVRFLELSVRARNIVAGIGPEVETADQLAAYGYDRLLAISNCGYKTVREIEQVLEDLGLTLVR